MKKVISPDNLPMRFEWSTLLGLWFIHYKSGFNWLFFVALGLVILYLTVFILRKRIEKSSKIKF